MKVLKIIWQLPQIIVFGACFLFLKLRKEIVAFDEGVLIHSNPFMSSAGFGEFILLSKLQQNNITINHERGHCRQSLYLGWLYLIVVGIPSLLLNIVARYNTNVYKNYYTYYPESWADKLGNVKR